MEEQARTGQKRRDDQEAERSKLIYMPFISLSHILQKVTFAETNRHDYAIVQITLFTVADANFELSPPKFPPHLVLSWTCCQCLTRRSATSSGQREHETFASCPSWK